MERRARRAIISASGKQPWEAEMSKLLVGYDGTQSAKVALERAAGMTLFGDTLGVISVAPIVAGGSRSGGPFVAGEGPAERRASLTEAVGLLAVHGIEPRTIEAIGDPASAICEAAERDGYTMIVVGSRNQNGVKRLVLGSVSDRVAHHSTCDVLIVK
jgi:nucleotide-binding universal stress UspA family protein